MVKNTDVSNQYLEHIRAVHDPALHIKTLEDELRKTMGAALGKQGEKVLGNVRGMEEQLQKLESLQDLAKRRECIEIYNDYQRQAVQARWELMVQRQAVGCLVNNQKFVYEKYPIGDVLPLPDENGTIVKKTEAKDDDDCKQFGDQLDWWQRVGRWR